MFFRRSRRRKLFLVGWGRELRFQFVQNFPNQPVWHGDGVKQAVLEVANTTINRYNIRLRSNILALLPRSFILNTFLV